MFYRRTTSTSHHNYFIQTTKLRSLWRLSGEKWHETYIYNKKRELWTIFLFNSSGQVKFITNIYPLFNQLNHFELIWYKTFYWITEFDLEQIVFRHVVKHCWLHHTNGRLLGPCSPHDIFSRVFMFSELGLRYSHFWWLQWSMQVC